MAQPTPYYDTSDWEVQSEPNGSGWRRLRFVLGGLVVLLAIGYLVTTNLQQTGVYYLTISEYTAKSATFAGHDLRLAGTVAPGSVVRDGTSLRFTAAEGGATLPVAYRGVVPDIFGDNVDVVVEGKVDAGGVFQAHTLLAKCPSRFEEELHDGATDPAASTGR